jgi:rhodanese-related sulfurtransferase
VSHEDIEVGAAHAMVEEGAFLLDVRTDEEWAAGHAPTAVHLPLAALSDRHTELPSDRRIVVVCRSGGRSARAADALVGAGYDAVNLAGGMQAWDALGLPVVTDAGDSGSVA